MSQTLEQAEELRARAIQLLLTERQQIDNALASLSYDGAAQPPPKKPYKKKTPEESGANVIPSETPV